MVRTMTGVESVADGPLRALMQMTGGRPMMVSEILEAWLSDGTLFRRQGQWFYKDAPLSAVESAAPNRARPMTGGGRRASPPEELAASRLEPMSPHARALVVRCAIIGRLLSAGLVRAVAALDEERFLDAIDEVVRAKLLVEEVGPQGVRYRFQHEAFRDLVVRSLPPADKASTHRFVARRIERVFARRRRDVAHVLARHFRQGGLRARSLRYLELMIDAATRRGDLEAAVSRLEEAMAIVDERPRGHAATTRRLRLTLRHIDVLLDFGRPLQALERADPSAAIDARSPFRMEADLLLRRATCQLRLGRLEDTLATLARMPDPAPTQRLRAQSLALEGRAQALRGEYELAETTLEAARQMALEGGLDRLAEQLEGQLGDALLRQGRYAEALVRLTDGLTRARARGDTQATAFLIGAIGIVRAAEGDDEEALRYYREAIELADARGVRADLERWSGELGVLLADMGEDVQAIQHLAQALDISREVGDRQGEATWRGELGRAHLQAGRPEKAAAELMRCTAIARDIGFALYEGYGELYLGALALKRANGDFTEAEKHVRGRFGCCPNPSASRAICARARRNGTGPEGAGRGC